MKNPASPIEARSISWWQSPTGLLLIAGILTSLWAWIVIASPVATLSNQDSHRGHFELVFVHMVAGTIMLFFGAANLYLGATRKHVRFHRLIGRTYLIGGAIGALLALFITLSSSHKAAGAGMFTNMSTSLSMLALSWMAAAAMGYRAIRNRRFDSHRDWMIRSYVLAWSFVFCRLASRIPAVGELGEGQAFIWLSWVGPLLLCEFVLQWRAGARLPSR